jgi:hypothetical protein
MKKIKIENLQKQANSFARKLNYWKATDVIFGNCNEPKIIAHVCNGYRKISNGQYVSKAYYQKGWSSCYYQNMVLVVMLPLQIIDWE